MNKKKWMVIGIAAVLVVAAGGYAVKGMTGEKTTITKTPGVVQKGNVTKAITATGTVNYTQSITLSFQQTSQTATKLVALNAKVGDKIEAGQVLAQLDTTNLVLAVAQQKANLEVAEAKLQQTEEGLDSSIKSTLSSAQQAYINAQQAADPTYLETQVYVAKQAVQTASDSLAAAQQNGNAASIASAEGSLATALDKLNTVTNNQNGAAEAALIAAKAKYDEALNQATRYTGGIKSADILSAEASVTNARAALDTAQTNLDNATLAAPTAGVITSVSVENYQTVSGSETIMVLAAGDNSLMISTAVSQSDIGNVQVGQKAEITIDSAPTVTIGGTVQEVALQGTVTSNVTTYTVKVNVDEETEILRQGMSANVSIIQEQAKDVLTVPSEAIKTLGRSKGVLISQTGEGAEDVAAAADERAKSQLAAWNLQGVSFVPVETGLDDGSNTEIKSGLTENQEIVVAIRQTTGSAGAPAANAPNAGQSMQNINRATTNGGPGGGGGGGGTMIRSGP
ncbi:MAG: efflux RND transporter periplasmic adaptor subunit [Peptococcaceae bacterium]|jgi:HlyD family secretion protein|nr:efflux RND transporter periplasmic adaptor subunit [Peptococcaceae bacterium]